MCACVCVCVFTGQSTHTHTHTHRHSVVSLLVRLSVSSLVSAFPTKPFVIFSLHHSRHVSTFSALFHYYFFSPVFIIFCLSSVCGRPPGVLCVNTKTPSSIRQSAVTVGWVPWWVVGSHTQAYHFFPPILERTQHFTSVCSCVLLLWSTRQVLSCFFFFFRQLW